MNIGDKILNAIGDDGLRDVVTRAANQVGAQLSDSDVATVVEAIKQGIRQAVAECDKECEMRTLRTLVRRETQRFMRQCGMRRF